MNLNDIKRDFLEAGGNLQHKRVKDNLNAAEARARSEAEKLVAPPNVKAAEWIRKALGWLAVAFFVVVLIVGVAALLIFIPAAEFAAVYSGLLTITPGATFIAGLTTLALFIGIIVLMFLRHVYEDALPRGKPKAGIRRTLAMLAYWSGAEANSIAKWYVDDWTKVERDYVAMSAALNVSKIAVLSASLIGRLHTVITVHGDKPVGEAIASIRDTLTGSELIGAVTSILLLYGILKMLDVGVLFSYTAFKNSAGALDLAEAHPLSFSEHFSALRDQYQAEVLADMKMQIEARRVYEDN